jgi:UrcA family protein
MFRIFQSVIVALFAATVFTPAVQAETGMTRKSVRVSYADLDISTAAGARTLHYRLTAATRQVCGPRPTMLQLAAKGRYKACLDEAMSNAVAQIDSPAMAARLTGQTSVMSASR